MALLVIQDEQLIHQLEHLAQEQNQSIETILSGLLAQLAQNSEVADEPEDTALIEGSTRWIAARLDTVGIHHPESD